MRRRIDVLARDLPVPDREDVDAVPLEPLAVLRRRGRGPLADHEVVADAQVAAAAEAQVRPAREDPADVLPHGRASFGSLTGGVVLEDDVVGVSGVDRVEILRVPGVVVGVDQVAQVTRHQPDDSAAIARPLPASFARYSASSARWKNETASSSGRSSATPADR